MASRIREFVAQPSGRVGVRIEKDEWQPSPVCADAGEMLKIQWEARVAFVVAQTEVAPFSCTPPTTVTWRQDGETQAVIEVRNGIA